MEKGQHAMMLYMFVKHVMGPTGAKMLITRGGTAGTDTMLEVWAGARLLKELKVPKKVHGAIFNDGWFGSGAAWSPDETKLAYVAEVRRPVVSQNSAIW